MAKKTCKHTHECTECIKEEIAEHQKAIDALREKLPKDSTKEILRRLDEVETENNKRPLPFVPYYYHNPWPNYQVSLPNSGIPGQAGAVE